MLSRIYEEHQRSTRPESSAQNEKLRKKAFESVATVNNDLVTALNSGVGDIFRNQRFLEEETRKLRSQGKRFTKQTEQWLQVVDNFTKSLKELGDVDSWAQSIEWDMRQIVSSLEKLGAIRDIHAPEVVDDAGKAKADSGKEVKEEIVEVKVEEKEDKDGKVHVEEEGKDIEKDNDKGEITEEKENDKEDVDGGEEVINETKIE